MLVSNLCFKFLSERWYGVMLSCGLGVLELRLFTDAASLPSFTENYLGNLASCFSNHRKAVCRPARAETHLPRLCCSVLIRRISNWFFLSTVPSCNTFAFLEAMFEISQPSHDEGYGHLAWLSYLPEIVSYRSAPVFLVSQCMYASSDYSRRLGQQLRQRSLSNSILMLAILPHQSDLTSKPFMQKNRLITLILSNCSQTNTPSFKHRAWHGTFFPNTASLRRPR